MKSISATHSHQREENNRNDILLQFLKKRTAKKLLGWLEERNNSLNMRDAVRLRYNLSKEDRKEERTCEYSNITSPIYNENN